MYQQLEAGNDNDGGEELQALDALHKFAWSKLITNIFEKMENAFMFGDLHLFINVINGVMVSRPGSGTKVFSLENKFNLIMINNNSLNYFKFCKLNFKHFNDLNF